MINNVKSFTHEWNEFDSNNFGGGGGVTAAHDCNASPKQALNGG